MSDDVEVAAVQVVQAYLYALDARWQPGPDDFAAQVANRAGEIARELAEWLDEWDADDDEPVRPVVDVIDSL